jgi:hypothetical protein
MHISFYGPVLGSASLFRIGRQKNAVMDSTVQHGSVQTSKREQYHQTTEAEETV